MTHTQCITEMRKLTPGKYFTLYTEYTEDMSGDITLVCTIYSSVGNIMTGKNFDWDCAFSEVKAKIEGQTEADIKAALPEEG